MAILTVLIVALFSFIAGMFVLFGYMLLRMMRNDGWDDSNITNALRLISHVVLHSEDFALLQYPSGKKPFSYVTKDELSEVVDSRP